MPKCRACKSVFVRARPLQVACCGDCAYQLAMKSRNKWERTEDKARREKIKTRSEWMKETQSVFNRWIRVRDKDQPCISCGRIHDGQWHAGHYLSTAARPELRFDPANCHKQCQPCNTHLHGNLVLYRTELVRRIGPGEVDRLEGPHEPMKWTIDDLRAIKKLYQQLTKDSL